MTGEICPAKECRPAALAMTPWPGTAAPKHPSPGKAPTGLPTCNVDSCRSAKTCPSTLGEALSWWAPFKAWLSSSEPSRWSGNVTSSSLRATPASSRRLMSCASVARGQGQGPTCAKLSSSTSITTTRRSGFESCSKRQTRSVPRSLARCSACGTASISKPHAATPARMASSLRFSEPTA